MGIIGKLAKSALKINEAITPGAQNPKSAQEKQLIELLNKAKNTAFGKYYGFNEIMADPNPVARFKSEVPIFTFEKMNREWWLQQQKFEDITWPGKPEFFARTSGTTGKKSKQIPITPEFLESMKSVGTSMIQSLVNFELPEHIFESEILMLSSSARLDTNQKGFSEGEISGINVSNFPNWYDIFYRPGKEIASISDWDLRIQKIAEEAPKWNIGAIAGIPSWVLLMLQKVISYNDLNTIHDIWPNLTIYSTGGVAFETYRRDFEEIVEKPLIIMDTYLASEGFFAYNSRPATMAMELALSHGYYFEFIPFDERGVDETGELLQNPLSFDISEVETDQDYVLVVSTCSGAWRYAIGDVIKFESLNPPQILITGRTKFFLNVVGSQLSEEKLDAAILALADEMGISINEYSVGAIKNDSNDYVHQWILVTDDPLNSEKAAQFLDKLLKESNNNYRVARSKALKGIQVEVISKNQYQDYLKSTKKVGGQVKTPKVLEESKLNEMLNFFTQVQA
jgi:hypothetical protein